MDHLCALRLYLPFSLSQFSFLASFAAIAPLARTVIPTCTF
jgi:hypothetical protein